MSQAPVRRIALATDLKDHSAALFGHCLALALHARAELFLVHIIDGGLAETSWRDLPTVRSLVEKWGAVRPDATAEEFAALGMRVHPLDYAPTDGDSRLAVLRRVADLKPDLVVMGTHSRHGFDRMMMPSVSEDVVRDVHRATLFVPAESRGFVDLDTGRIGIRRVMIPISSEVAQQPLIDELTRLLTAFDVGTCSFTFVHVGSDDTLPSPSLPARADWAWRTDRRSGSVVDQILEAEVTHQPDLIAMATEGPHGLLDALRGSTTERVLRRTHTPLLTVPVAARR